MQRAAIYARFSTDRQNEKSIDDQVVICRDYAARHGLVVVATYDDRAVSGASIHNRPGMQRLIAEARENRFDVVVAESTSRLGRDQEDRAAIRKRLRFLGIALMTPVDGAVTDLIDGVRAVVDSQQIEDLKHAVRRGLAGVIRDGRNPGGMAYGYAAVKGEPGHLVIVEEHAEMVRRIFREFVAGDTARDIARRLNAEGVAPPRGKAWNASTINGNGKRANGIIRNELYVGRLIWNRQRFVKDPDTGRRVSRPNPRETWHVVEAPEFVIVPHDVFEAAQRRIAERKGIHPSYQRRPRHLLSGLLRCAACGSGMSIYGRERGDRRRLRCTRAAESGTCPDPKTFSLDTVETAVLGALRDELRHPDVIAEFVRTYHDERRRLAAREDAGRATAERRVSEVRREIDRIVDGVAKGVLDPAIFGPRASELDAERKTIEAELAAARPAPVVTLHPGALKRYESMVARLQQAVRAGVAAGNTEHAAAIRDLIETVTVRRIAPGKIEVEIAGRLTALLGPEAFPHGRKGVAGLMVAGVGFEPTTFRL